MISENRRVGKIGKKNQTFALKINDLLKVRSFQHSIQTNFSHSKSNRHSVKKSIFLLLFAPVFYQISAQTTGNAADARLDYIKKYQNLAVEEMERTGIPASIKLAQAILESNAGQSTLALEANNHFGIKCGGNWDGKSFYIEDDDRDASGNPVKSCFRKYKKPETSFEDHSEFLRDPKKYNRYGFLFKLNPQDYRSWAYGLQSAGYATSQTYAESLISVIERYKLNEYDKGSSGDVPPPIANRRQIGRVNDVKVVAAKAGETLDDIGRIYRLRAEKLIDYNDGGYARGDKLQSNTRVFIQKKQKRWRGRSKFHFVRDGQTMWDIAQLYGVRLENLQKGNKMDAGEEPADGEEVRLKGFFWKKGPKPKLRQLTDPNKNQPADPNQPPVKPADPKPQPPKDTKMTTDEEELFEMGEGKIEDKKPQPTNKPSTGTPSTSGEPLPTIPPTANPKPSKPNDIVVQPPPTKPTPTKPTTQPTAPAGARFHTIVKGDTLYNISKRYGLTVDQLRKLNGMTDDYIQIGQQLRVK